MMGLIRSASGQVKVRYVSADIGAVLSVLEKEEIAVFDVRATDELTLEFSLNVKDWKQIQTIANRRGESLSVIGRMGLLWPLQSVMKRPLLVCGILLIWLMGSFLTGRILFIEVEGNERVPERLILEAAEQSGLGFGVSRRGIRSEQIKNKLLDTLPELKWAGVNTYGSRAVITVRERDDTKEQEKSYTVAHIAAACDGIVVSSTVTSGTGTCSIGQAVKKGDILISGYTDCGLLIRAEAAKGQIVAATRRNLTVVMPVTCHLRRESDGDTVRYSLILGKKRINFYKGSGISGGSCGKMLTEYVLTLPGGFELPVILTKESLAQWDLSTSRVADCDTILKSFASGYLDTQMISGTVIQKEETVTQSDEVCILQGQYACIEDIGIAQDEKIGDFHGKTDGTDRERRPGG